MANVLDANGISEPLVDSTEVTNEGIKEIEMVPQPVVET
jgi:hypothetical protein